MHLLPLLLALGLSIPAIAQQSPPSTDKNASLLAKYRDAATQRWEQDIAQLEALDQHAWKQIRAVNAGLRNIAMATPNTYFIPTAGHYLRPDGTPRAELFREDKLHLNAAGYQLWGSLIRRRLDEVFRLMAATEAARD